MRQGDRCQAECDQGYYQGPDKTCLKCDKECAVCIGPGDRNCTACENYELPSSEIKLTRTCVEECPDEYSRTQKVDLGFFELESFGVFWILRCLSDICLDAFPPGKRSGRIST